MTKFHMGQSITGPLRNWKKPDWKRATRYITRNDGGTYTADELKDVFLKELALGHEVVPIGECDNWDWKTGCRGHPQNVPIQP
jgi:hypothetical protein